MDRVKYSVRQKYKDFSRTVTELQHRDTGDNSDNFVEYIKQLSGDQAHMYILPFKSRWGGVEFP